MCALCAAAMRGGVGVVGGFAAVLGGASWPWLVPALVMNLGWTAVFTYTAVRRGLVRTLMVTEIAFTGVLCLAQGRLVAQAAAEGGTSWVAGLATMSIVVAGIAWRPAAAVPGGLVVAAAHLAGAQLAGVPDGGVGTAGIHLVQIAATATLMSVLRRAAKIADGTLSELREQQRAAAVERAARADERELNRRLHDTALATLVVVGTGGIPESSAVLRARAEKDLADLAEMGERPVAPGGPLPQDRRLAEAATRAPLDVRLDLAPVETPPEVTEAFSGAAVEALANVARHAGTGLAGLQLHESDGVVYVEVDDEGPGFDPDAIPVHRYGVREAIIGRMRSVKGDAEIVRASRGSSGTTVRLWWSRR